MITKGGASITRSPLTPSACPVLGHTTSPSSSAAAVSASAAAADARSGSGSPVRHQFHAGQEAAPTDVAHQRMLAEPGQPGVQSPTHVGTALDQTMLTEVPDRGDAGGAEYGMMGKRLGMLQSAGAGGQDLRQATRRHHCAESGT